MMFVLTGIKNPYNISLGINTDIKNIKLLFLIKTGVKTLTNLIP